MGKRTKGTDKGVFRFLNAPQYSLVRESLVNYKFFYDIKVAGARAENDIRITVPEVDIEGYDVFLDDGDKIRPFQLKTKMSTSGAGQWKIQRQLIRPNPIDAAALGFDVNSQEVGLQGGLVLLRIEADEYEIRGIEYFYCDAFVLRAFELGVLTSNNIGQGTFADVLGGPRTGGRHEKFRLPMSLLIRVAGPEHFLALADMHCTLQNGWTDSFRSFLRVSSQEARTELTAKLRQLVDDKRIAVV